MRLRLHIKFALWLLLAGILPLAIMGGYSIVRVKQTVQTKTQQSYLTLGEEIAQEVNRIVSRGVNSVYYLAENPLITSDSADKGQLEAELSKTQRFHPIIKDLTLLDKNGNIRASALYSFRGDWTGTSWYRQAVKGERVFTGVHSVLYPFDVVMTTAVPVYFQKSQEISGVLVGQLNMESIWKIFNDVTLGTGATPLLIDNRGVIIASAEQEEILEIASAELRGVISGDQKRAVHIQREGRKELLVYVPLPRGDLNVTLDWYVIFTQPVKHAYAATGGVLRGLYLAGGVSLVIVAIVSTILSKHINRRIRPLINATRQLGKGDFSFRLKGLGQDEIGELGDAFSKTASDLAETTAEVKKYQENLEALVKRRTKALEEANTKLQRQIEERIRMEEERKNLEELFRQSQKMEAVGTLAGGIAHDFNNILQMISGQIQLLRMDKEKSSSEYSTLTEIDLTISRATELVRRLLTFSRKMESAPKRMNLNEVVSNVVKLLSRTIPKMITIETHMEQGVHNIYADYTQMEQVIMNLTSNAVDAMPDGGTLTIRTENKKVGENNGRRFEIQPGEYVVLHVSDTGTGMDEATRKRIFEPFFTSKEVGKGTGLGLSTVYGIVKEHNGYIDCSTKPGEGTTFSIYFPECISFEEQEPAIEQEEEISGLGGLECILVVDDEAIVREIAEDMLSRYGYRVYLSQNAEEAMKTYENLREKIDLVITDIGMPGMGGEKLLKRLLALDPHVKVIVASGYIAHPMAKNATSLGARAFVKKPYPLKKMLKTIRQVLDQD